MSKKIIGWYQIQNLPYGTKRLKNNTEIAQIRVDNSDCVAKS